jgi:hypothetical protein
MESDISTNTSHRKPTYNWEPKQSKFAQRTSTSTYATIKTFNYQENDRKLQLPAIFEPEQSTKHSLPGL